MGRLSAEVTACVEGNKIRQAGLEDFETRLRNLETVRSSVPHAMLARLCVFVFEVMVCCDTRTSNDGPHEQKQKEDVGAIGLQGLQNVVSRLQDSHLALQEDVLRTRQNMLDVQFEASKKSADIQALVKGDFDLGT